MGKTTTGTARRRMVMDDDDGEVDEAEECEDDGEWSSDNFTWGMGRGEKEMEMD